MKTLKNIVSNKIVLATVATILVVGGVGFALEKTGVTHLTGLSSKNTSGTLQEDNPNAKTTSRAKTAQSDFDGGDTSRQAGNTLGENRGSGIVSDNSGVVSSTPAQSSWTTSATGEITLYTPSKSALLASGSQISGSSSLSSVSFRLIDNISGQISTGKISVVNGKFSGTASFNTNATIGQLDIFGAKADGTEFSNISIPVRFR